MQPAKQANGNVVGGEGGGGGGGGGGRHKKRVRQPHNTAERQRQKAVGRGEYIMESTQQHQENGGHDMNGYNNGYNEGGGQPNSIEMRRAYEQQQMQQQQQHLMNNGPMMTGMRLLSLLFYKTLDSRYPKKPG